jgi:hypothetical protein
VQYFIVSAHDSTQFYRNDLMEWRRRLLGLSAAAIARETGIYETTVRAVFKGKATSKQVYPVSKVLGLDWAQIHNLELKESDFHLAVTNGNGSHLAG